MACPIAQGGHNNYTIQHNETKSIDRLSYI